MLLPNARSFSLRALSVALGARRLQRLVLGSRPRILDDVPGLPQRRLGTGRIEARVLDGAFTGCQLGEPAVLVDRKLEALLVVLLE